ncbi:MAG: cytochrome ubiquinol oxidase subunit I [Chloroflexota bacterium]
MQPIQVPILGNSWFIGVVALVHVLLVTIGGVAPLVAFIAEQQGLRKGDERYRRLAKAMVLIVLEVAVIGGIFGSGLVVVLIGLFPQVLLLVVNVFFWFLVLQLLAFIAGLGFLFAYLYTWERPQGLHRAFGAVAAALPLIVMVVFSAGSAFTNTPGRWAQSGAILAAVFNPTAIPSLLHRIVAGFSLTGFLIVAYALYKGRRASGEERGYYGFALGYGGRYAVYATILQVIPGAWFLFSLPPEAQRKFLGGELLLPWGLAIVLAMVAVALVYGYTREVKRGLAARGVLALAVVLVVATTWLMGYSRSQARGSDLVYGVMNQKGDLTKAPPAYLAPAAASGEALYAARCGTCHPGLAGDPFERAKKYPDDASLAAFLKDPASKGISMPPFVGTEQELRAVIDYLRRRPG